MESTFEVLVLTIMIALMITLPLTIFGLFMCWRVVRSFNKIADSIETLTRHNTNREQRSDLSNDD